MSPAFHVPVRVGLPYVARLVLDIVVVGVAVVLLGSAYEAAAVGTVRGLLLGAALLVAGGWIGLSSGRRAARFVRVAVRNPVRLRLDDGGISVTSGLITDLSTAYLSWGDCAAVVVSPLPLPNGKRLDYVQFVPVHDDRVHFTPGLQLVAVKATLCRVSEAAAAMVWMSHPRHRQDVENVVAQIGRRRPDLRVVSSLRD